MPAPLFSAYRYQKTTDLRSAMAETLAVYINGLSFSFPRGTKTFRFAEVYDTWSTFQNTATSAGGKLPAAAVLPGKAVYDDSSLTARMLEETWSGAVPPIGDGSGDGFALFTGSEMVVPFVVVIRAVTIPSRKAILSAFEDAFIEDDSSGRDLNGVPQSTWPPDAADESRPQRYGKLLTLPAYYRRRARFTLQSIELLDASDLAMSNRWMAQAEITAEAQHCLVRQVRAMRPRVRLVVGGEAASQ